jgi:hypothetical protein
MADSTSSANKEGSQGPQASTEPVVSNISMTRTPQPTFLGQTKASWYIYWICAVASIANIFQGFDSGIYSIIISDSRFIDYFNISGARSGVVASMGEHSSLMIRRILIKSSELWKRDWESSYCLVVHCISRTLSCFRPRDHNPPYWCCIAGRGCRFCYDSCGSNRC